MKQDISKSKIVLIDFHAAGHHPTYLKLFADALGDQLVAISAPQSEPEQAISDTVARLATFTPVWSRYWRWRGKAAFVSIERFFFLARVLRQFERAANTQINRVVFACLYDGEFRGSAIWKFVWKWDWSALYLHPIFDSDGEPSIRGWMKLASLRRVALLDETRAEVLSLKAGKPFVRMPDAVFPCSSESEMRMRLRALKGDRFGVILTGFLHPQKGVVEFLDLVDRLDSSRFFFVLVGAIHFPDYEPQDQERLLRFSQETENGFAYFQRVIREEALNGLIEECDVVFAAYRDWKFSSNAVGKACAFRKSLLVTSGELMGDRVERFRLGLAIPEGDVAAMESALITISESTVSKTVRADWEGYLEEHSVEAFSRAVSEMVE